MTPMATATSGPDPAPRSGSRPVFRSRQVAIRTWTSPGLSVADAEPLMVPPRSVNVQTMRTEARTRSTRSPSSRNCAAAARSPMRSSRPRRPSCSPRCDSSGGQARGAGREYTHETRPALCRVLMQRRVEAGLACLLQGGSERQGVMHDLLAVFASDCDGTTAHQA